MDEKKRQLFEEDPIAQAIFKLALPTTIGMLVMVLYNLVDTYFIGLTNDPIQVAAVSLAMPFFLVLMACGNLFGIGAASSISRHLGSKSYDRVKNISSFAFYSAFALGLCMGAATLLEVKAIVTMTGADLETAPYVKGYLTTIAYGAPVIILSATLAYIIRSEGNSKEAMIGMVIGTFTNIFLDPIFIFALDYGVIGAAIATVFANLLAVTYYVFVLSTMKNTYVSIKPKDFRLETTISKDVLSIGIPASLNNLLMSIATIIYNVFLAKYGTDPVAAMGIVIKITMIYMMLFMGLSTGVQPLLGYTYGAKQYHRLKEAFSFSLKIAIIVGVVCLIVFYSSAEMMVRVFINDDDVVMYGTQILRIQVLTAPLLGITYLVTNLMQVAGKGKLALFLSVCRQGIIFVPAVIILDHVFAFQGLVWTQPVCDVVCVVLSLGVCGFFFRGLEAPESQKLSKK